MEDDKELIVLIVENTNDTSQASFLLEELTGDLNPETGEFSQIFKKERDCGEVPMYEDKFDEFGNDGTFPEFNKSIDEIADSTKTPEIKEEVIEVEYDLALKELNKISEEHDNINSTCFKEELYLPNLNDSLKCDIEVDNNDMEKANKSTKIKRPKKKHQSVKKFNIQVKKNGRKFMKPFSEHVSFVNELRCQFPELEQDEELLICTLANIMKDTKTPDPPANYYTMNGSKYKCTFCEQLSHTQWVAKRHYQYRHGSRYLVCFACGTDFRSVTTLYKHEKRCCNKDAVIVLKARAQIIGDKGRNRPFLDEEKRREEILMNKIKNMNRSCSECSAEFSSKDSLEIHMRLHTGHRPFRCSICSAAYTSKRGLKRHMEKHSNEEYICDVCEKTFKIKACLINHLNTHLPDKKYKCIECEKRYTKKIDFDTHVATKHLNQPCPHSCPVCDKGFLRMSALKYHMKNKHGMTILTRRGLLCQLPKLSDEAVEKNELLVKAAVVVKNPDGTSKIMAPR